MQRATIRPTRPTYQQAYSYVSARKVQLTITASERIRYGLNKKADYIPDFAALAELESENWNSRKASELLWLTKYKSFYIKCPTCNKMRTFSTQKPRLFARSPGGKARPYQNREFRCNNAKRHPLNPTAGTILFASTLPVAKWMKAFYILQQEPVILMKDLAAQLDITTITAYKVAGLVMEVMPQLRRGNLPAYWPSWKEIHILLKYDAPEEAYIQLLFKTQYPEGTAYCPYHKRRTKCYKWPDGKNTYQCGSRYEGRSGCPYKFTITTDTIFYQSKTSFSIWFKLATILWGNSGAKFEELLKVAREEEPGMTPRTVHSIHRKLLTVVG